MHMIVVTGGLSLEYEGGIPYNLLKKTIVASHLPNNVGTNYNSTKVIRGYIEKYFLIPRIAFTERNDT